MRGVGSIREEYRTFGATLTSEGSLARRNPFRFSSEYADDETGLVYYNWRHYDPVHGIWLGRDPIGPDGGANLYAFCGNDPIGKCDELGLFVQWFRSNPFYRIVRDLKGKQVEKLSLLRDQIGMTPGKPLAYVETKFPFVEILCKCEAGSVQKWVFYVAKISVQAEVHMRPDYNTTNGDPSYEVVLKNEMDHVNDLLRWVGEQESSKVWAGFSRRQKRKCFKTEEECIKKTLKKLNELLDAESEKEPITSMRRWDKSGKHTWKVKKIRGGRDED